MFYIISWVIFGAIVGSIAQALHPGDEKLGCWQTVVLGVIGSFVGGGISYLLGWSDYLLGSSNIVMSIIGAVVVCALWVKYGHKIYGR